MMGGMRRFPLAVLVAAVLAGSLLAGCGDGGADRACGPIVVEQLDPDGGHLIAGVTPPSYLTDPPTSGPHTPGTGVAGGVLHRTLTPIQQVTTLEGGAVIIQYRDARDAAALGRLAGPLVVVAPNPTLPQRVIATGWVRKMTCRSVDRAALGRFVHQVVDRYVGHASTTTTTGGETSPTMGVTSTTGT
jgi:hypothetical protein